MSKLMTALCCLMLAASPLALAQDKAAKKEPTEAQKKQQERMKACNAKAGEKKLEGDARKKFMSTCLSGDDAGPSDKQKSPAAEDEGLQQAGGRQEARRRRPQEVHELVP